MLKETSASGQAEGADLFFPCTIYSLLQLQKVEQLPELSMHFKDGKASFFLKSNIVFVQSFRHESRLEGEEDYYLTTIASALEYVHDLKESDLKMGERDECLTKDQSWANFDDTTKQENSNWVNDFLVPET